MTIRKKNSEKDNSEDRTAGPSGQIEIRIFDEPCRDSMSGAYFGLSATVVAGGLELRGCVLRGTENQ